MVKRKVYDDVPDWLPPTLPRSSSRANPPSRKNSAHACGHHPSAGTSAAGPSSSGDVIDLTTPPKPKAKRQRKAKDPDAPVDQPEKRGAIFKKKCPKNILERVDRVISQRFFMVDRKREGSELREEFSVLGSTGNVYTVVIGKTPSCNCPDHLKGNHCKHILFIFLKVLQVTQDSGFWYQKALLTSELETIFAEAPLAPNALAHPHVREAFARATGKKAASSTDVGGPKKRVPGPEDDCPICYEGMHGVAEHKLAYCDACGNAVHKECFQNWAKAKPNPTCVFCRAKWVTSGPARAGSSSRGGGAGDFEEGYLNLGRTMGLSPERDTSSYYHGPRRGQRYYGY